MRNRGRERRRKIERTLQCAVEPLEARRLLTVTLYVDPTASGNGDGQSWGNAFNDLQPALTVAQSDELSSPGSPIAIDVAQGTYKPTTGTDAAATFHLVSHVSIVGGFADGGSVSANPRVNVTTLSGDLGQNSGNSYNVVTGSGTNATAVLDGFTISGGHAGNGAGGGMLNISGNPTVNNCTFSSNTAATQGGAIANFNSSPTLTGCTFTANSAADGAAVANLNGSAPVLVNCTFTGNTASTDGGAMYNYNSSPQINNCMLQTNHAQLGGAMYNRGTSDPILTNCLLASNTAIGGGAIADSGSAPDLINCNLTANSASQGGAFFDFGGANPVLVNCIVWANTAPSGGEIMDDGTGNPSVTYTDIQGGFAGTANVNADPRWTNPAAGNYQLLEGSPCIDAGNNAALPAGDNLDLASEPRIINGVVDIGAIESPFQNVTWTGAGDGVNWGDKNNWSNKAVPNAATRVTIPAGVAHLTIGAGNFAVDSINCASSLLISGGLLAIHGNAAITGNLTMQNGGSVDLTNAGVAVNYPPGNSPLSTLTGYLHSGAIFSSTAQSNPRDAIGYADGNADIGTAAQPNQVLIKYTVNGDSNLDNVVNFQDLVAIVQNFNKTGTDWAHGNFLNGPSTNFNDLVTVVQNFNKRPSPPAAGAAAQLGGSIVPLDQPASVSPQPAVIVASAPPAVPAAISRPPLYDADGAILQSEQSIL